MARTRPVGVITRGTTNPNRLRRCDRWLAGPASGRLRRATSHAPVVVDLGFGASPVTAVELHERLSRVRADVEVVGIEIDPDRVAAGLLLARPGLSFRLGGFEVPLDGRDATVVRAFNVLRQYPEEEVAAAWASVCRRLTADGVLVDGTCDELGRLATWVAVERSGPVSLSLSWHLRGLDQPSVIAERLPKALIHRNVPGEPVHDYLTDLDRQWARSASHAAYGVRQRFLATAHALRDAGWPLLDGPARWRLGELTVAWDAVAPGSAPVAHQGP
ncbi:MULTISPECIES: class I SAM-dependent methyltransferase [unclassified Knoellia]|uniref:class I SAM-dependent methyltransferase n=1 Tax=Knoellia altitudinis TaxID=3404795 RepID=UPI0036084481